MNIYFKLLGGHYHMRVFVNRAKCGDLCCRKEEWEQFQACFSVNTVWIPEEPETSEQREFREYTETQYMER